MAAAPTREVSADGHVTQTAPCVCLGGVTTGIGRQAELRLIARSSAVLPFTLAFGSWSRVILDAGSHLLAQRVEFVHR